MWRKKIFLGVVCLSVFLMVVPTANAEEVIYSYGFEQGLDGWIMDNAIWELCLPSSGDPGPQETHEGFLCVGTVCDGNYPAYEDSRLISPEIELPGISGDEEIHLRFWHWFSYSSYDYGYVQVSVQDAGTGEWSPWETVPNAVTIASVCNFWHLRDVELTAHAGQNIKIGFYHTANRDSFGHASESSGWYIDDIEVIKKIPVFTGNFENGWGDWTADDNIWEVGTPGAGPSTPHGGTQCAGTVLDGNYQGYRDSRLISPFKRLESVSGNEEIHLRFWHWFSYSSYDAGYVQISIQDEGTGEWCPWETISTDIIQTSGVWTPMDIDLTAYADHKVRIAFYHTAGRDSFGHSSESSGWYMDDISVITKVPEPTFDFECGWNDWSADKGIWEVGEPTSGPETAYSGFQCAATVLDGNYQGYTDSHFISPSILLPECEELNLTFRHWFSYSSYDYGYVQISIQDKATGICRRGPILPVPSGVNLPCGLHHPLSTLLHMQIIKLELPFTIRRVGILLAIHLKAADGISTTSGSPASPTFASAT